MATEQSSLKTEQSNDVNISVNSPTSFQDMQRYAIPHRCHCPIDCGYSYYCSNKIILFTMLFIVWLGLGIMFSVFAHYCFNDPSVLGNTCYKSKHGPVSSTEGGVGFVIGAIVVFLLPCCIFLRR